MHQLLAGAAAGVVATIPMTAVMELLHVSLPGDPPRPLPPREVTEGLAVKSRVSSQLSERDVQNLTLVAHFGYGAACGAMLGALVPRHAGAAAATGVAFGLGVWAGSYLGWLPALGVRQHARHDPLARSGLMIAAHVVWGAAAGLLARR